MAEDIDAILARRAELKKRDPDAILLFRVEDTYRAFGEDARAIYRLVDDLGATLIYRGKPDDRAEIPAAALEPFLARVVAAGRRAAVCERKED